MSYYYYYYLLLLLLVLLLLLLLLLLYIILLLFHTVICIQPSDWLCHLFTPRRDDEPLVHWGGSRISFLDIRFASLHPVPTTLSYRIGLA